MSINSIGFNYNEDEIKKVSINIRSNTEETKDTSVGELFEQSKVSGLSATTSTRTIAQSAQSLMQEADDVLEQLKVSAESAKGSLDALFKKLSGADCVELDKDGYSLNDTKPEKIVTVVERIKIMLATYCDDYNVTGSPVSTDEIEQVVGSASLASKVANKFNGQDVPATKENVEDTAYALEMAKDIGTLSEGAKNYLVKNNMEPTIDNLYNAKHALNMEKNVKNLDDGEWNQLKPQIEKIINEAGLEINDKNINNAKAFLAGDIPITKENLKYKAALDAFDIAYVNTPEGEDDVLEKIASALSEGKSAKDANLLVKENDLQLVSRVIGVVNEATEGNVRDVVSKGLDVTVNALEDSIKSGNAPNGYVELKSKEEVEAMLKLTEIQILMTADAGLRLAKQGFNLDTTPLERLADELRKLQLAWVQEESKALGHVIEDARVNVTAELVYASSRAIKDIACAPDDVIGAMLLNEESEEISLTIENFASSGNSMRQRYRRANETYEAVVTEVRADLGDSINKAISASLPDLLNDLGLEDNKANRDAIRILANNNMEMSQENVEQVKEVYSTLKNLIDNMDPATVLSMIRDGINPMKDDIRDVNAYLQNMNETMAVDEKFSKFLYKLDRTNGITSEERKQFIGIYKMMNIFKKDAGKAVGQLLRQGADITMSNLISAYESRKAAGIDKRLDEDFGMAEGSISAGYFDNLFSQNANKITPLTLKKVQDDEPIENRSVENFEEALVANYDANEEASYYEEYISEQMKIAKNADLEVLREIARFDEPITLDNIRAMQMIMGTTTFYFDEKDSRALFDAIDDEEALETVFDNLEKNSDQELENVVSTTENLDDLEIARMRNKQIHLIKGMGHHHDYHIPFETNGELATIHLQIVEDDSDAGRIAIDLNTNELGNIHIEAKMDVEQVSLFAVCDKAPSLLQEKLAKSFGEMENVSMHIGQSDVMPKLKLPTKEGKIATTRLYTFSKEIISSII